MFLPIVAVVLMYTLKYFRANSTFEASLNFGFPFKFIAFILKCLVETILTFFFVFSGTHTSACLTGFAYSSLIALPMIVSGLISRLLSLGSIMTFTSKRYRRASKFTLSVCHIQFFRCIL